MHKAANWANYPAQDQKRLIDEIWAIATKDDPSKRTNQKVKRVVNNHPFLNKAPIIETIEKNKQLKFRFTSVL